MQIKYEPLSTKPHRLSPEKREWWLQDWGGMGLRQPRLAVFQHAMNTTPRPTVPDESIAFGYVHMCKFFDREPQAILSAIRAISPDFFVGYPTKAGTELTDEFIRTVCIGEAARAFYREGYAAYGRRPGCKEGVTASGDTLGDTLGGL